MFYFAASAIVVVTAALVTATIHSASAVPMQSIVSATHATGAGRLVVYAHTRSLVRRCDPPPCPARAKAGFPRRELTRS
jgi:hypothetical protein